MKKTLGTMIVAAAVILLTATFSFAEFAAAGATNFPYLPTGLLNHRRIDYGFSQTQI